MIRDMLCLTYSYDVHAPESHALPRQTRVQYGDVNTGGVDSGVRSIIGLMHPTPLHLKAI